MIKPTTLESIFELCDDLIPQAVIDGRLQAIANRLETAFEYGRDDLDAFTGIGAMLDNDFPFALLRYNGHPKDTFTIYLSDVVSDVEEITSIVAKITNQLGIGAQAIVWQRKDDPDL